ncbi:MAG: hypothetical protein JJE30_02935 [Desulfuromonadales bacterium]|nr:hypothetical protein [Desulfuromonadales bacterium]
MSNDNNQEADKSVSCKYCLEKINEGAKVCHNCGKDQRKLINKIQYIASSTALLLVIIAGVQAYNGHLQYQEAKRKRIEAEQVLNQTTKRADEILLLTQKQFSSVNMEIKTALQASKESATLTNTIKTELSTELSVLNKRNKLTILADKAITEADRKALNDLERISKTSSDKEVRLAAVAEGGRVISFWLNMNRIETCPKIKFADGSVKDISQMSTDELITQLRDNKSWVVRRECAKLLSSKKQIIVVEALVRSIKQDPDIEVSMNSLNSFKDITNPPKSGLDIFDGYIQWWEHNSKTIIKNNLLN